MDSHINGPTKDLTYGSIPGYRRVDHVFTTTTDTTIVNVVASALNPVMVAAWFAVTTVYNGTSPSALIVRDISGTETTILASSAVTETTVGTYGPGYLLCTADCKIQLKFSVSGSPTTGAGIAIVEIVGCGPTLVVT